MDDDGDGGQSLDISQSSDYGTASGFYDAAGSFVVDEESHSPPLSPLPPQPSSLHPSSDPELGHAFPSSKSTNNASSSTNNKPPFPSFAAPPPSSPSLIPRCLFLSCLPCQEHRPALACFPDPTQGPYSTPSRNVEVFRALLHLLDGGRKQRAHFQEDPTAMRFYYLRQSYPYQICVFVACVLYLSISLTEVPDFRNYHPSREGGREGAVKKWYELGFDMVCVLFFVLDVWVHCRGVGAGKTFRYKWTRLFVMLLVFDVVGMLWPLARVLMVTGIVRCFPIVYFSKKARNATLDYLRTVPSILQWIAVEFLTILVFACFGVVLFANIDQQGISGQDAFLSFKKAFISLYALSLTVNDPDVYLPYYNLHAGNIALFVVFLVLSYFLLHNIILARVFRIYSVKLKETALKRNEHRESALVLAFQSLLGKDNTTGTISKELVAYVLQRLLPWYSSEKIAALMEYVDRDNNEDDDSTYDFDRFSLLMTAVGDDRLHTVRATVSYPGGMQQVLDLQGVGGVVRALATNGQYWHSFYTLWFWAAMGAFRIIFTLDMVYGMKQLESLKYYVKSNTHKCKLLALVCFLVAMSSMIFALLYEDGGVLTLEAEQSTSKKVASLFVLLTSCCDVFCLSNRVTEYAALLKVFKELLVPAFLGQATVIFTLMHLFCYLGMYFFGGRIYPSQPRWATLPVPASLYYLLNFNTYLEGMLTLFMLMVVNNWQLISGQFVSVTQPAAYLYFMAFQILVVTVALSCVTSFFITHLSSQLGEELEKEKRRKRKGSARGKEGGREGGRGGLSGTFGWGEWMGSSWKGGKREGGEGEGGGGGGGGGRENGSSNAVMKEEEERMKKMDNDIHAEGPKEGDPSSSSSSLPSSLPPPPPSTRPTRFRLEKRVSSCTLVLKDDQPVAAVEYRCLLETMLKEKGRKTAYCFVKEKRHKPQLEIIQRSTSFARVTRPYPDMESIIFKMCQELFVKENTLKLGREEKSTIEYSGAAAAAAAAAAASGGGSGGGEGGREEGEGNVKEVEVEEEEEGGEEGEVNECVVVQDVFPHPVEEGRALYVRVYFLMEGEGSLAYCQVQEE